MLHRELEDVDRRVTRSRARAYRIPLRKEPQLTDAETARRESIRKGKLPIRTPRQQRANEAVRLIETEEEVVAGFMPPGDAGQSTSLAEPEFDEDGNAIGKGNTLSSASSSSSSDDEFY